jgi:hypothetical protein
VQVFNVPGKTAKMLRADLEDAEIPYVDGAGCYAYFHSLRHSCGSLLAAAEVHPKVAQSIMRHSNINLTLSRYTHTLIGQESEAVANLPDLSLPSSKQKNAATGTNDRQVEAAQDCSEKLTLKSTPFSFAESNRSVTNVNLLTDKSQKGENHNHLQVGKLSRKSEGLSSSVTDEKQLRLGGFEPLTFGSVDRCSIQLSYRRNYARKQIVDTLQ